MAESNQLDHHLAIFLSNVRFQNNAEIVFHFENTEHDSNGRVLRMCTTLQMKSMGLKITYLRLDWDHLFEICTPLKIWAISMFNTAVEKVTEFPSISSNN